MAAEIDRILRARVVAEGYPLTPTKNPWRARALTGYQVSINYGADGDADFVTSASTLSSIDAVNGDTLGLEVRILTGLYFTGATDVKFGSVSAVSFTEDSDTQITCTVPAQAAGSVNITVITPSGTSNGLAYEYWDPTVPMNPTWFAEKGGYAIAASTGTWTKRAGSLATAASQAVTYPVDSGGAPQFVSSGGSSDRLIGPDTSWGNLIGLTATSPATIAVIADITSLSGPANNIISDGSFYGALYFEAGTSKVTFAYYDSVVASYDIVSAPAPATGRVVVIFQRVVSGAQGYIRISTDGGSTWFGSLGTSEVFTLRTGAAGIYLGYNTLVAIYPLDATLKTLITVKKVWSAGEISKFMAWAAVRYP